MASTQEVEEIIRSLNGDVKPGKDVEDSAKKLLLQLLRCTDDKDFVMAASASEIPFITFRIYLDRIVVDSNHDGFDQTALDVLCQPNSDQQPSFERSGSSFKSFVIATKKVHIQSRGLSVEFEHSMLDSENGMMKPIKATPSQFLSKHLTRITLYFHDQGNEKDMQNLRRVVLSQFENIQETSLLFLKRIRTIRVENYDESGKMIRSKDFHKKVLGQYRTFLRFTTIGEKERESSSQLYHVTEQPADDLATSVILAFPITDGSEPHVAGRIKGIFNIVQMRKSHFKFHIHSDFDIDDEGRDIAATSTRNLRIRGWVATAFFRAILQFLEDPVLCYHWPLFLPEGSTTDLFWSGLEIDIRAWIIKNPIFRSKNTEQWRLIHHLLTNTSDGIDEHKRPLLEDPNNDSLITALYPQTAVNVLEEYGLKALPASQFIEWVDIDLNGKNSKIQAKTTSEEWHSAMARLLSKRLIKPEYKEKLRSVPILQLTDGTWTSLASGPIYFPTAGGLDIPDALGLRLVSRPTSSNPDRSAFSQKLGVAQATVDQVREWILARFTSSDAPSNPVVVNGLLRYLYLTHKPGKGEQEQSYDRIRVLTRGTSLVNPQKEIVYLPGTDHAYTPESLLTCAGSAPLYLHCILEPTTLYLSPSIPSLFHPTWRQWLCGCVGIQEQLSILQQNPLDKSVGRLFSTNDAAEDLSDHFQYVLNNHPEKFLGLFEYLWVLDKTKVLKSPALVSKIRDLPAQNLCGVLFPLKLQDTWLPYKYLLNCVELYMENPDTFPSLKLHERGKLPTFGTKWDFLTRHFGVKCSLNLDFLLEILKSIKRSYIGPLSTSQTQKVFDLYAAISEKFALSDDKTKQRALELFDDSGILYIDAKGSMWTSSSCCLWSAPPDMMSVCSLKSIYSKQSLRIQTLQNLFHKQLDIRDATLDNLVTELNILRNSGCEDVARIMDIYRYLDEELNPSPEMRHVFDKTPLIFVKQGDNSTWRESSKCAWSEAKEQVIDNNLSDLYKDLKDFFLKKLGVKQSAYDKLLHLDSESVQECKASILSLVDDVHREQVFFPEKLIPKGNFLPVRHPNGTVSLCSVDSEFAIGDRDKLATRLEGDIKILDFGLAEVRRLWPLISWLFIEDRCLSRRVKEWTRASTDSGCLMPEWGLDLRRKAYHIVRVAATFNSPRFHNNALILYSELLTMQIIETGTIFSEVEIIQDGKRVRSKPEPALVHISDVDDGIVIYVPKDWREQQLCLQSALPRKLGGWLMRKPYEQLNGGMFEMINALTSIISSPASVLSEILDAQDIVKLPFEDEEERKRIIVRLSPKDGEEKNSNQCEPSD
ncbi:hypothetical protein F53441_9730 [Fusarium austroafricanum]|uniref:Uncharacterized protein n=1 Tax=Fusarium austroafricanum TaxID=2364996 RepID=A0A8H4NV94_9HYPO|nr:hypothetical protein F53441_9730 [Fusarium austroafricanum]